jgi:glycine betaine catabolism B
VLANGVVATLRRDRRFVMTLTRKEELAQNTVGYWFEAHPPVAFQAGQYLEWSLPHLHADARGVRRYFTIASSPTESHLLLASRHADPSSSYKKALHGLKAGDTVTAMNLGGSFVLPAKPTKCVFIAGGIGVTPFRSHIKWLLDTKNSDYDIVLLYSNKTKADIAFTDLFSSAEKQLPFRTVYALTDEKSHGWHGITGYIDEKVIREQVPDFAERMFYISGPEPMVQAFDKMLGSMGIKKSRIKRDFFPGYSDTHAK